MDITIPVYQPSLNGNEKKYVNECLDSTWISSKGKFINQFEDAFSAFINVKYAAAVSNGTVALHVALIALGIGPGDEVIVPTLTYIASVNAISYTGAKAVFVDSLVDTWQMDPGDVVSKITSKTKAIMAVHLYGHPCEMDSLKKIATEHKFFLVEDCAEAIGSEYKGKHVGTFGDIATFSFFGNKMITTGEGGMVVTNDQNLHERVLHFKGQGLSKNTFYWHDVIGYNYRMTNICAAIGLAQLEQVEYFIRRKIQIAELYQEKLKDLPVRFHTACKEVKHTFWMCSILITNGVNRDLLRNYLTERGIETRPLFFPIHTMPMYLNKIHNFQVAVELSSKGINLPSYPTLTDTQVIEVSNQIRFFFDENN
ncbi:MULTISPECIES: DegT/DnrJ/EryC1/StrS aminotransferase family protein [unclassified Pedobacter]|uniref:DegT/DnrJ/EryC1/StrS family aminotransferase n=1 Tax=unclassified Pedobacter TaxID=2628915 RepID=UPI001D1EDD1F|nr:MULTISPECIES: DegT/DnrJ/EryC1/StrS family aminotransferase [unclassified Pedobacter]CAH0166119.1 GDP-perosamine synthase [Pedobacter sp. Bi126]CAH0284641.1 GDP-perosamine synthase [Pedobacter sp. Bi36]